MDTFLLDKGDPSNRPLAINHQTVDDAIMSMAMSVAPMGR